MEAVASLSADEKRSICDVRLSSIAREAYSNLLTAKAFTAMGKRDEAAKYMAEVESLNRAFGEIDAERTLWEASRDDDR